MKYLPLVARLLLGIPLLIFGAMGLFSVWPDPRAAWEAQEGFTPEAVAFIINMWESGFLGPTVAAAHLVTGLLLVINRYVPFALALHLPVSIQMSLFHVALDMGTGAMAFGILLLNILLIYWYRSYYSELLSAKAEVQLGK